MRSNCRVYKYKPKVACALHPSYNLLDAHLPEMVCARGSRTCTGCVRAYPKQVHCKVYMVVASGVETIFSVGFKQH